jgi:hypothetical protein
MLKSYCIISDYLNHDATSVNVFLSEVITELKRHVPELQKIYYFSDGGPAHYTNRFNFASLSLHVFDFTVDGEWHFFASCHGKGSCDGVRAIFKRCSRNASLQRDPGNQIDSSMKLLIGQSNRH